MSEKHGSLQINSENIFPIIKKWLYSDHDIFVRELISNGCDAITKLKKLDMMGEYHLPDDYEAKIQVIVSPEDKTMKFIDNGIGMTADEAKIYWKNYLSGIRNVKQGLYSPYFCNLIKFQSEKCLTNQFSCYMIFM